MGEWAVEMGRNGKMGRQNEKQRNEMGRELGER